MAKARCLREVFDNRQGELANLSLSVRTIETHKYEMMETLGLHSKAELVRWLDRRLFSD